MSENDDDAREIQDEIARYRLAAEETLEQIQWCVNYLHRHRKSEIANVVDANRRRIRQRMSQA